MNSISPLGWAAIFFVIVITVLINLSLVAVVRGLRNGNEINQRIKMPKSSANRLDLQKAVEILRDPFADERRQLNELSRLVQQVQEPPSSNSQPDRQE